MPAAAPRIASRYPSLHRDQARVEALRLRVPMDTSYLVSRADGHPRRIARRRRDQGVVRQHLALRLARVRRVLNTLWTAFLIKVFYLDPRSTTARTRAHATAASPRLGLVWSLCHLPLIGCICGWVRALRAGRPVAEAQEPAGAALARVAFGAYLCFYAAAGAAHRAGARLPAHREAAAHELPPRVCARVVRRRARGQERRMDRGRRPLRRTRPPPAGAARLWGVVAPPATTTTTRRAPSSACPTSRHRGRRRRTRVPAAARAPTVGRPVAGGQGARQRGRLGVLHPARRCVARAP